jgi:hypothetical protein
MRERFIRIPAGGRQPGFKKETVRRTMDKYAGKIESEKKTVAVMVSLYCNKRHGTKRGLCPDCEQLLAYAKARLAACPFGDEKKACSKCTVHCYRPEMREKIAKVMRFSGPRMLLVHPLLAFRHLKDR